MQNENLNLEQPAPVVEKVSKKSLKSEQNNLDIENNKLFKDFIDVVMTLSDEDLDKAIAFLNKKRELLKKLK